MKTLDDHRSAGGLGNVTDKTAAGSLTAIQSAIEVCAKHAAADVDAARVVSAKRNGRNSVYVVSIQGNRAIDGSGQYFVKERLARHRPNRWRVDLDYAGLMHVTQRGPKGPQFGSIEPVAYSMNPRFLVTGYQPGPTLDVVVTNAIKHGVDVATACEYSGLMGRWLAAFRQSDRRPVDGDDADRPVESVLNRLHDLRAHNEAVRRCLSDSVVNRLAESWTSSQTADRFDRPAHGDMGPQNFILGADEAIYPIDFSAFTYRELENDLSLYRVRLEKAAVFGGRAAAGRATTLWQAFLDEYTVSGESIDRCVLSYFNRFVGLIFEGAKRRGIREFISPRVIARSIRDQIWIRGRYRWLSRMPESSSGLAEYFRNEL